MFNFTPLEAVGVKFEEAKLNFYTARNHSVVADTETVVGEYRDYDFDRRHIEKTLLTFIHHYRPDKFQQYLASNGFAVVQQFLNDYTAVFVIKKRKTNNHNNPLL